MARNPELDYEFKENNEQQKPYIFTSADTNAMGFGGSHRRPNLDSHQNGVMAAEGSAKTGLKGSVMAIIGVCAVGGGALLMWIVSLFTGA